MGSPGDSRTGRRSSRPHKPCSEQAQLSGIHTGSSSRMEPLPTFLPRGQVRSTGLSREGLTSDCRGLPGKPGWGGGQYFSYLNGARIFWGPGVRMKLRKQHCAVWSKVPK